jgi:hypothetical protein
MGEPSEMTYAPLGTLKSVAEDVWIVDGPIIRFGMPWPKMPFSTRMTIIRMNGGDLLAHSPTPLSPELKAAIAKIGIVRWIVGPNRLHYSWIPAWRAEYPDATIYLAPRIREHSKGRIDFAAAPLEADRGYPWDAAMATLPVPGGFMTEVEFFHYKSRTLILTDLIENFERRKLNSRLMRWMAYLGGAMSPNGSMPRDLRLTFRKQAGTLRAAIELMISWNPERIILSHGLCYEHDGARELRRAFRWILE